MRIVALGALIFCAFVVAAAAQGPVQASYSPNDATASVKTIIDQSIVVFKDQQITSTEREQKLRAIAESHFDFAEMAQSAIGYHWKTLTPAQKSRVRPTVHHLYRGRLLVADRIVFGTED